MHRGGSSQEAGGALIKSTNTMKVYELDGKETRIGEAPEIVVESHWNKPTMIVLVVGGMRYTVFAPDLEAALKNAQNTSRH